MLGASLAAFFRLIHAPNADMSPVSTGRPYYRDMGASDVKGRRGAGRLTRTLQRYVASAVLVFLVAGFALLGSVVALRAGGSSASETALGVVEAQTQVARRGAVDAYVPLLDWGVRVEPYRAPVEVRLRLASLDRERLLESLRSGEDAERQVAAVSRDLERVVRDEVRRAVLLAVFGGLLGGLFAAALINPFRRRPSRRFLAVGGLVGLLTATAVVGASVWSMNDFDAQKLNSPTFYARGSELPRILRFAAQIEETTASYTDSYEQALTGLSRLLALSSDGVRTSASGEPSKTMVLMSDLHANTLVLPALGDYVDAKTVFFVGDFTQLGTHYEEAVVPSVARLGKVYAVSGNHDSRTFMRRLAEAGVTVLTRNGVLAPDGTVRGPATVDVAGLRVVGYDDPLESRGGLAEHDLELKGQDLEEAQRDLVEWFDGVVEREGRPDVVLIHQRGLARALLAHVEGDEEPLLVLTGHTHKQAVERRGLAVLVDGGTVGAGGPFAIGVQPAGFALIHFAAEGDVVSSVDLIEAEPLSGAASADHVVLDLTSDEVREGSGGLGGAEGEEGAEDAEDAEGAEGETANGPTSQASEGLLSLLSSP